MLFLSFKEKFQKATKRQQQWPSLRLQLWEKGTCIITGNKHNDGGGSKGLRNRSVYGLHVYRIISSKTRVFDYTFSKINANNM